MKYIEAVSDEPIGFDKFSVFLAGGITGCFNWQAVMTAIFKPKDWYVVNPRRANFPMDDPNAAEEQIKWEFDRMARCTAVLFWFPHETLCPITLYELGKCSINKVHLFIGVHPGYKRKLDVEIQTKLLRPEIKIAYGLTELGEQLTSRF